MVLGLSGTIFQHLLEYVRGTSLEHAQKLFASSNVWGALYDMPKTTYDYFANATLWGTEKA